MKKSCLGLFWAKRAQNKPRMRFLKFEEKLNLDVLKKFLY